MADPISSLNPSTEPNACLADDNESLAGVVPAPAMPSIEGGAPAGDTRTCSAANSDGPSAAVSALVDKFSPSRTLSFVQGSAEPKATLHAYPQENNATRTTARTDDFSPYAASGSTGDGQAVFAAAALVKAHVTSGVFKDGEVELLSGSAQVGKQSEVQAGLLRLAGSSPLYVMSGAVNAEALTARANYGIFNDDGSIGFNAGATVEAAALEATVSRGGWSLTAGLSAQLGASVSAGFRDADADGNTEACFKLSLPLITVGACADDPF